MSREQLFVVVWVTAMGTLAREPLGGISRASAEAAAAYFNKRRPRVQHWVEPLEAGALP